MIDYRLAFGVLQWKRIKNEDSETPDRPPGVVRPLALGSWPIRPEVISRSTIPKVNYSYTTQKQKKEENARHHNPSTPPPRIISLIRRRHRGLLDTPIPKRSNGPGPL